MRDRVMLPAATEIEVAVPKGLLVEHAGVRYGLDGQMLFTPLPPGSEGIKSGVLRFGGHHLGEWVVTAVTAVQRATPAGRDTFVVHLHKISEPPEREPLDDDFALWLKARRDEWRPVDDEYRALDDALDAYREHRATGTPLNQEIERD